VLAGLVYLIDVADKGSDAHGDEIPYLLPTAVIAAAGIPFIAGMLIGFSRVDDCRTSQGLLTEAQQEERDKQREREREAEIAERFAQCDRGGPAGTPALVTVRSPQISEPQTCDGNNGRLFVVGRGSHPLEPNPCVTAPCLGTPNAIGLQQEIVNRLLAKKIRTNVLSIGATHECGTPPEHAEPAQITIYDWAHVDAAVEASLATLAKYDLDARAVVYVTVIAYCDRAAIGATVPQ